MVGQFKEQTPMIRLLANELAKMPYNMIPSKRYLWSLYILAISKDALLHKTAMLSPEIFRGQFFI